MRILHVTDFYRPRVGGIEMFVEELAKRQSAAGDDVTILCPTRGDSASDPLSAVEVIRVPSRVPVPLPLPILPAPDVLQLSSYDVVHAHLSIATPFSTKVAQAAVRAGVPTITTVHSIWTGGERWVRLIGAIAGWHSWPVAWTAVSAVAAAAMQETLGADTPVHVVPNAVEVEWWRELPKVADPGRPFTVVTVMRLTGRKRPVPLLEVLARVRREVPYDVPLRAVVVGEGPLDHKMRSRIASLGIGDWVEVVGGRSREEIRETYRHADAYVAPSHRESFGLAALEARAAGLPVVAMRTGGVGEFVLNGVEGFLCHDDDEMTDALVRLAADQDERHRMAAHNVAHPPMLDWSVPLAGFAAAYARAEQAIAAGRPQRSTLDVGPR
jgi:phosphatidylinositol alpha 1,6-mannosyltransferase